MNNKILLKKAESVVLITLVTMLCEVYFGYTTHSMALLADGFHMGGHALALLITAIVCYFALRHRTEEKKFNALGGYTSAILLGITAIVIITESIKRMINPLTITFSEAITVATIGLVINIVCIFLLGETSHKVHLHNENLNYQAAYLHILADAFTSLLAIGGLLLGKYFGFTWPDALIGIIGGLIIAKWSAELLNKSGKVLLDL